GDVPLESLGSVGGISGVHDVPRGFYEFESFLTPATIHQVDLAGRASPAASTRLIGVPLPVDPTQYRVVQRRATSKDGTAIPYTLVHRQDVDLESRNNPTLLYGYGGFNLSLTPMFVRTVYPFMERGGVYVQANLRGGGEFGEAWHRAGQLGQKQNVFDDFYAVAQALVETGVTTSARLGIYGRSNGGLLTAAAITQHPEMYRAAVSVVPLTDMVRYPRFLMAQLWTPEYGSPTDADAFAWLYAYSPYHRVAAGTAYPATLLMTAASDTRVDPAHARKMTAALQAANASTRPILLRTEEKAGHGAGKPMSKVVDEHADLYAFVMWQLGMLPPAVESR
ncbi:MAG TPA: prolyl oligopeptidase family serine peptidase, partial [Polyangiaceae bacterium]|nr:prolyl oligopeptidase family serine peptidase [Polyangiaceae bacterium]